MSGPTWAHICMPQANSRFCMQLPVYETFCFPSLQSELATFAVKLYTLVPSMPWSAAGPVVCPAVVLMNKQWVVAELKLQD